MSVCPSVRVSLCLSVNVRVSECPCVCVSISVCPCVCVSVSVCPSVRVSVCPCLCEVQLQGVWGSVGRIDNLKESVLGT